MHNAFSELASYLKQNVIGQDALVENLLIALLADGHLLVEGPPGLAKTRAIKSLADAVDASFHRVQFTPDLLPADLTGSEIYRPEEGTFKFQSGPLFHQLVLADEINRAPAKVQSALLEAMAERQITVGKKSYPLSPLFLVMATQNPIEQEGTYPLPEAQLDRFLLHVSVDYPDADIEHQILAINRSEAKVVPALPSSQLTEQQIFSARKAVLEVQLAPELEDYLVHLIIATRHPDRYDSTLARWLEFGASPRATIALDRVARARAWLQGRDFVTPEDIQVMVYNVLRHRLVLSYEAEAEGITSDQLISRILDSIPTP